MRPPWGNINIAPGISRDEMLLTLNTLDSELCMKPRNPPFVEHFNYISLPLHPTSSISFTPLLVRLKIEVIMHPYFPSTIERHWRDFHFPLATTISLHWTIFQILISNWLEKPPPRLETYASSLHRVFLTAIFYSCFRRMKQLSIQSTP